MKKVKEEKIKVKTITYKKVLLRKMNLTLLCFPFGVFLLWLARKSAYFTEYVYAQRIFKAFSYGLSFLTGHLPFSLAEFLTALAPILVIINFAVTIIRIIKNKKEIFKRLLSWFLGILSALSVGYLVYALGCGMNYHRYSLEYHLGLEVTESSKEELSELCLDIARDARKIRNELNENENGVFSLPFSLNEYEEIAKQAMKALSVEYPIFKGTNATPKAMVFSEVMSNINLTGIYTCYTMEANYNVNAADFKKGSTMCHELAHLRGFIKEDEANYISYLACMKSESKEMQYSGLMMALIYAGNALAEVDIEEYRKLWSTYSDGMIRDILANNEYWKQYQKKKVSQVSEKVNDNYLKANDEEDGVKSYGRVVDLLLAARRKQRAGQ
ncbi:MAG: DUF3810 domain-containing protein [Lachnospiraceae bacterium]|nr:DUF3810 domain-containing protein [Lachnospiraceae bacterium]